MARLPEAVVARLNELQAEYDALDAPTHQTGYFDVHKRNGAIDNELYLKIITEFESSVKCVSNDIKLHMISVLKNAYPVDGRALCKRRDDNLEEQFQILLSARKLQCKTPFSSGPGLYVFKHHDGRVYVVRSSNMGETFNKHSEKHGEDTFVWSKPETKGDPGDLEAWERNEVLHSFKKYGISKVRGWAFTDEVLSKDDVTQAIRQVCDRYGLCRQCANPKHSGECSTIDARWWTM